MSSFVCAKEHFDFLLTYAINHVPQHQPEAGVLVYRPRGVVTGNKKIDNMTGTWLRIVDDPSAFGQVLLDENIKAYSTCYRQKSSRSVKYQFTPVPLELVTPAAVIKASDCYEYQSCEDPEFRNTFAFNVYNAIREAAIAQLVTRNIGENPVWEWTSDKIHALASA